MKRRNKYGKSILCEEGFSLVEILVALTLTTVLIGFAFGIYLFGQRYFIGWKREVRLQNELHTTGNGISEEIFQAEHIIHLEDQELELLGEEGKKQRYEAIGDSLLKNNRNLLNPALSLVSFELSTYPQKKKLQDNSDKKINKATLIEFSFAITNGEDTLSTRRRIYLRKPSNWNLLRY